MVSVTWLAFVPPAWASSVSAAAPVETELAGEEGVPLRDHIALGDARGDPCAVAATRLGAMLVVAMAEEKAPCASGARAETLRETPNCTQGYFGDDHAMALEWLQAQHACRNEGPGRWAPQHLVSFGNDSAKLPKECNAALGR